MYGTAYRQRKGLPAGLKNPRELAMESASLSGCLLCKVRAFSTTFKKFPDAYVTEVASLVRANESDMKLR